MDSAPNNRRTCTIIDFGNPGNSRIVDKEKVCTHTKTGNELERARMNWIELEPSRLSWSQLE